jgi:hypothetical protein
MQHKQKNILNLKVPTLCPNIHYSMQHKKKIEFKSPKLMPQYTLFYAAQAKKYFEFKGPNLMP